MELAQELRTDSQRDMDKLFYTYYFRRLAEITQVASHIDTRKLPANSPEGETLPHNRLTHSLKVGQVAGRIAQYLQGDPRNHVGIEKAGGLDPAVAEVAGRAHDLGHPPYGHIGEEVLDEVARRNGLPDGFEGNAHTFRILSSLIRRRSWGVPVTPGLGLTPASLAACVKYPWAREAQGKRFKKFGYINPDAAAFEKHVLPRKYLDNCGTLEAQIMDWADDISYAAHDIEDFTADTSIPLYLLAHDNTGSDSEPDYRAVSPSEMDAFWGYVRTRLRGKLKVPEQEARRAFAELSTSFPRRRPDGHSDKTAHLDYTAHLGFLASQIITEATTGCLVDSSGRFQPDPTQRALVDVLKQLTWFYVIDTPKLVEAQWGHRRRLRLMTDEMITYARHAFRQEDVEPWGEVREIDADQELANIATLPPLLRDFALAMLRANQGRGAYLDERDQNIVRAVIDFVAGMREEDVTKHYALLIG